MVLIKCMCRFGCVLWLEYSPLNVPPVPLHHPRSTETNHRHTQKPPSPQRHGGRSSEKEQMERTEQHWHRQPQLRPWCSQVQLKMGQDLGSLPLCWMMQISSARSSCLQGIVQCYLPSNKDDRAEVHCLILLQTNRHPNFSGSFGVGMPHTPATSLLLPPCPRLNHVTRHGQWETGGHLSTHFLLLDKASGPRHSLLFYQELWNLHYTNANMCKLWTGRR